jgi:ribosome-associated toxin RatA of RatAB toxin-antitoxin module
LIEFATEIMHSRIPGRRKKPDLLNQEAPTIWRGEGNLRTYRFRDDWHVDAPPTRVWDLISQPATYPQWCSVYQEARVTKGSGGVGTEAIFKFRVLLPYSLSLTSKVTRSEPPLLAEGTVSGELDGTWRWTLESDGDGTRVIFEESVTTNRWFLDLLSPIAYKLFEMNHHIWAKRSAEGMRAFLERETSQAAQALQSG